MNEHNKNYEYYNNRITSLTLENTKLQESVSKMSKDLLTEKTRAYNNELWFENEHRKALNSISNLKHSLWITFIVIAILFFAFVLVAKNNLDQPKQQHSKEFIFLQNKADSIFTGSYTLYPTDTAFMHICNAYGDTLQVMVTSKH